MQGYQDESILKSVYCNYRGRVTVYDVHGQKVHELSGMLDYDKYLEIERRTDPEITQFEGLEDYRCIVCELKKKKSDTEAESTPFAGSTGSCASISLPNYGNFNPSRQNPGTSNSGYRTTTNSGYISPLPRSIVAPRVAPLINSMPLPAIGGLNSVVSKYSSGVLTKNSSDEGEGGILPENTDDDKETKREENKDKRIENRWWKRIFK